MATQQILFAETIAGMKKAFKRKAYESDSDSEIESFTNRGHKLQKRARFQVKGRLTPTTGPSSYKEAVEYAGVQRQILYRNPPLVDNEGYEIVSDDDDERVEDAHSTAAELNPFSSIHLEQILAPLIASSDLPNHPTLSKPFTSKTLAELTSQSCSIMRKENQSLWQVRHLWTSLCGDGVWMPCETMLGPNDVDLFSDGHSSRFPAGQSNNDSMSISSAALINGRSRLPGVNSIPKEQKHSQGNNSLADASTEDAADSTSQKGSNARGVITDGSKSEKALTVGEERVQLQGGHRAPEEDPGETTAEQSRRQSEPQVEQLMAAKPLQPKADLDLSIHPMFLSPAGATPDRDMGLPEKEAEDIRRLLALYVQKQEEVCRGAGKLHLGLLRALRLRNNVLHWAKAEAHCGPNRDLSDGEDWYDKEEWGLTEDLKKGQDEEEEDTTTTGKKTRARRN